MSLKFVDKLVTFINTCGPTIGHWNTEGNHFKIVNSSKFNQFIKPVMSIATFQRQLTYYGFTRCREYKNGWMFEHKYFQRDNPELLGKIVRICDKHSKFRKKTKRCKVLGNLEQKINELYYKSNDLEQKLNILQFSIQNYYKPAPKNSPCTSPILSPNYFYDELNLEDLKLENINVDIEKIISENL